MVDLEEFKVTFFQETQELLDDMENDMLLLQDGEATDETINAIFRAVHSAKGGAGAFGLDRLVDFAHVFETLLDRMRNGEHEADEKTVGVLLKAGDRLGDLMNFYRENQPIPDDFEQAVMGQLQELIDGGSGGGDAAASAGGDDEENLDDIAPADFDDIDFTPMAADSMDEDVFGVAEEEDDAAPAEFDDIDFTPMRAEDMGGGKPGFLISFTPKPELIRRANEPLLLIRELKRMGELTVETDASNIPELKDVVADATYFSWKLTLVGDDITRQDVEDVFDFVVDDCDLTIEETTIEAEDEPDDSTAETEAVAEEPEASSSPAEEPVAEAPAAPPAPEPEPEKAEEAAKPAEARASPPAKASPPAPAKQQAPATQQPANQGKQSAAGIMVRVDLEKVDRVVNMVGELVITEAMLTQIVEDLPEGNYNALWRGLEELIQQTRELQENVMSIRAQPVRSIFQRLPRLVREVAEQTGKKVRLETSGENTEVDKTVVERLSDPLTHMIRNAVDHGIESPEDRLALGKPEFGTVHVSADQRGGRIIIEIRDDGKGIDRNVIFGKAVEKGLVDPEQSMTDEEVYDLIFHPGFSTAAQVTSVSGRGVGMDVVRRNIQNLGGRVIIKSTFGRGSTFQMSLPLTLAVMDGMVVSVGKETYIVPLGNIIECLHPTKEEVTSLVNVGPVLRLRGEVIKLITLATVFDINGAEMDPTNAVIIVAESDEGSKIGLVVDELRGQQQVVVKSIEENYQAIDGVAAATILGNGQVALILDLQEIPHLANRRRASLAITTERTGS